MSLMQTLDEEKLILALATATKIGQNYKVALDGLGSVGLSAIDYYLITDFLSGQQHLTRGVEGGT
jgi:hypothetical protein